MEISLLTLLIILPLIGAIVTLFMGGERQKLAKYVAAAFSAVTLVIALMVMFLSLIHISEPTRRS